MKKERISYFWGSMSKQICNSRRGGKYSGEGKKLLNWAVHKKTKIIHFSQHNFSKFFSYINLGFKSRVRPASVSQQSHSADWRRHRALQLKNVRLCQLKTDTVFLSFFFLILLFLEILRVLKWHSISVKLSFWKITNLQPENKSYLLWQYGSFKA